MKKLLRIFSLFLFFIGHLPFGFSQFSFDCEEELFSKKDKKSRLFGYVNAIGEYRIPPVFLAAKPFVGRNAIVQQGKLFGVINCEGVLVVPAEYEEIASFSNGKGWVKKGGLWGLVDVKGRLLIAPLYEEVKEVNTQSGTVSWVKKKGNWGLVSKENGRFLVETQYEDVSNLSDSAGIGRKNGIQDLVYYGDGRIIISNMKQVFRLGKNLMGYQHQEGKFGAFNSLAYILIRPHYEEIALNDGLVQVKKEGLYGLKSSRGSDILECQFEFISPIKDGFLATRKNNKWALYNSSGLKVGPEGEYDAAQVLPSGLAWFGLDSETGVYDLKAKKWLIETGKKSIRLSASGLWLEVNENANVRLLWFQNRSLWKVEFDSLSIQDSGPVYRAYQNGKVCLTQFPKLEAGKWFDKIISTESGYFISCQQNKMGILNKDAKEVLVPEFDHLKASSGNNVTLFAGKKEGKKGLWNEAGKNLLPSAFLEIIPGIQKVHLARNEKGWGLVGEDGKVNFEARYDSILFLKREKDLADFPVLAFKKGKVKLLNQKCEELSEGEKTNWIYLGENAWKKGKTGEWQLFNNLGILQGNLNFEDIRDFSEGNAPAQKDDKWGFVDLFGKLVIPAKFEEVLPFQSGIAYARENGKWGVLKKNGAWLVKPIGTGVSTDGAGKRKLILP
jgi:hypothetical protein